MKYICSNCDYVGKPKTITKGSLVIEVILWLLIIVPGVLYSLWRHWSRTKGCSNCGSELISPYQGD